MARLVDGQWRMRTDQGSPFRENGIEGLRIYPRVKTVPMRYAS
jgi:hypothetical protein